MQKIKEKETIILGADHAGFRVKEFIKKELLKRNYLVVQESMLLWSSRGKTLS